MVINMCDVPQEHKGCAVHTIDRKSHMTHTGLNKVTLEVYAYDIVQ